MTELNHHAKSTRVLVKAWRNAIDVILSDDDKGYHVHGDERISREVVLPRVTSILNIIEKQGLRTWAMNMALQYVRDNLAEVMAGPPGLADAPMKSDYTLGLRIEELLEEAAKAHLVKRDTAADYGTEAHALLQQLVIDPNTAVPDKFAPVVNAWDEWLNESDISIIATEMSVYYHDSVQNEPPISFAGTADLIAVDSDNNPVICDYKTGAKVYPEYALQMGAYSLGLSYCGIGNFFSATQLKNTRAFVIRLPKEENSSTEIKEVLDMGAQREAFLTACKLRQWQSSRNKWVPKRRKFQSLG